MKSAIKAVVCALLSFGAAPSARAAIFDSINASAATARPEFPIVHDSFDNIGWYYTPAVNYTLTGIYTKFGPAPASGGTNSITVQIQSERPVNGGAVLGEASFTASQTTGGVLGGSFTPIQLTAGQKYFVDFLNVRGMGVNVGTWDYNSSSMPELSLGATVNLGSFYRDDAGQFANASINAFAVAADGVTRISGTAPILMFEGYAVPEPSTVLLLMVGAGGMLSAHRRKQRGGAGGRTRTDTP